MQIKDRVNRKWICLLFIELTCGDGKMDTFLGSIIDDYTLYRIFQGIIIILSMFMVYIGIHIALTWKFITKFQGNSVDIISQKGSFIRRSIFIIITGFFMLSHEIFEGLEKLTPDSTTYELFELIAFSGLVLFLYEWYKIFTKLKKDLK
jgi:ABC-type transport system involved in cytochrome c biogenesis permease subunit